MSKKANPAMIGGFVMGAVVCAIVAVMLFGGGAFFDETFECIVYFDESISGLDMGAPVDFQGVRIGTVTAVGLEFSMDAHGTFYRPVLFQLEGRRLTFAGDNAGGLSMDMESQLEELVAHGLRARLQNQSLLTGKLKIELGFFPDTEIKRKDRDPDIWEMPSISSPLQRVMEEVAHLPLKEMIEEAYRAIQHTADILDPDTFGKTLENTNQVLERLNNVVTRWDEQFDPLADQAQATLGAAEAALEDISAAINALDQRAAPFWESMTEATAHIDRMLDPHSPERAELSLLIRELRSTSRSLRLWIDYMEQHPESLLRGKRP